MKLTFLPIATVIFISSPVFAKTDEIELPAMIISADFRPNTAHETPVSLTMIDSEVIKSRGAQHMKMFLT